MKNVITKLVDKVGSDKVMHVETCALIAVVAKRCSGSVVIGTAVALGVGLLKEQYDYARARGCVCGGSGNWSKHLKVKK